MIVKNKIDPSMSLMKVGSSEGGGSENVSHVSTRGMSFRSHHRFPQKEQPTDRYKTLQLALQTNLFPAPKVLNCNNLAW